MDEELKEAIRAQYDTFRAPAPRAVEGCPCCVAPEDLARLVATPRERLTEREIAFFASSAVSTVGSVEDLRHFWPRIAELSLTGGLWVDAEIVFGKLQYAGWRDWPAAEQEAILRLVRARMGATLREPGEGVEHDVDTWVCAFAQFMEDVTDLLPPLLDPAAASALLGWHALNARKLARGKLRNAFWSSAPENAARVVAWLRAPKVEEALERAVSRA